MFSCQIIRESCLSALWPLIQVLYREENPTESITGVITRAQSVILLQKKQALFVSLILYIFLLIIPILMNIKVYNISELDSERVRGFECFRRAARIPCL